MKWIENKLLNDKKMTVCKKITGFLNMFIIPIIGEFYNPFLVSKVPFLVSYWGSGEPQ